MASSDINYSSLADLVQVQLDWITANAPVKLATPLGPFIQAIAYSVGLVGLVLQRLIQLVLRAARLTTATGDDVDTFVADFGLSRNPAVAATGQVVFSKAVPTATNILIPVGTIVQTAGGNPVTFTVVADTSNPNYGQIGGIAGYVFAAGTTSVTATVIAVVPGAVGNVGAGAINTIGSTIPGVDNVSNAFAFTSGIDIETDDALKARFALYIQSLGKATVGSIAFGVEALDLNLKYKIYENIVVPTGTTENGTVTVVVDDGSGATPPDTLTAVQKAVELYRPAGVRPIVLAATPVFVGMVGTVQYDPGITANVKDLNTVAVNDVSAYVNGVPINGVVHAGRIIKTTIDASSPGDVVQTAIAANLTTPSTSSVLQVLSTEGMVAGQLVQVGALTNASGALPSILSVDSVVQITLNQPLLTVPPVGTLMYAFSVNPDQIIDLQNFNFSGTILGNTTTNDAVSTSTAIHVTSLAGFATNQYIIVNGFQTNPGSPDFGIPAKVTSTSTSPNRVNIDRAIGHIQADGSFFAVGAGGVAIQSATPVYSIAASMTDVTLGLQQIALTNPNYIMFNFAPLT